MHQQNAGIVEAGWQNGFRNKTAWLKSRPKRWLSNTITHFYFSTRHHISMLPHTTFILYWEPYLYITKRPESFKKSIVTRPQFTLGTIYKSTDIPWIAFTDRVSLIWYQTTLCLSGCCSQFTCFWLPLCMKRIPCGSFLFYLSFNVENPHITNHIFLCTPNWSIN